MDFTIPEDARMIQEAVRRFIRDELLPLERDYLECRQLPAEIGAPIIKKAQEQGLWAMDVPEEYGGQGLSELAMCLVDEERAKVLVGREVFGRSVNRVLMAAGTAEQKQKWLIPTIKGELKGCGCLTEPGAGSDLAALQTSVVWNGTSYVLNGSKLFTSGASQADYAVVLARLKGTQRREGVTCFVVPTNTPGFRVVREIPTLGIPPLDEGHPCEVALEDCVLSPDYLLGEPGQGWRLMQSSLGTARLRIGARAVGIAERCLDMAIDYAKQRVTFHEPLSARQAIQWMLADSAVEIHSTRLMVYHGAWKIDRGEDARQEIAMVKLAGSEMAGRVVDRVLQIHGAVGYSKDMVLEKYYRDVRAWRIIEGASEIQRFVIARNLLRD